MKVLITVDGTTTEHDVDLGMDDLSMRQAVRLEKILGVERIGGLFSGDKAAAMLPTTIQGLIFVQLEGQFPGLELDGFDFNLSDMADDDDDIAADDVVVDLPMTLPDGTTTEGASAHVDPTEGQAETA